MNIYLKLIIINLLLSMVSIVILLLNLFVFKSEFARPEDKNAYVYVIDILFLLIVFGCNYWLANKHSLIGKEVFLFQILPFAVPYIVVGIALLIGGWIRHNTTLPKAEERPFTQLKP